MEVVFIKVGSVHGRITVTFVCERRSELLCLDVNIAVLILAVRLLALVLKLTQAILTFKFISSMLRVCLHLFVIPVC